MKKRNNIILIVAMTILFIQLDAATHYVCATESEVSPASPRTKSMIEITVDDYVLSISTERIKTILTKLSEINKLMKYTYREYIDFNNEEEYKTAEFKGLLRKYVPTICRSLNVYLPSLAIETDMHPERLEQLRKILDEYAPYAKIERWLLNFYEPLIQGEIQDDIPYLSELSNSRMSALILSKVYESFKQNIDLILYYYSNSLTDTIYNQITSNGRDCFILKEHFLKNIERLISMYRIVFDNLFPGVDFFTNELDRSKAESSSQEPWRTPTKDLNKSYVRSADRIMTRLTLPRGYNTGLCSTRDGTSCIPCH